MASYTGSELTNGVRTTTLTDAQSVWTPSALTESISAPLIDDANFTAIQRPHSSADAPTIEPQPSHRLLGATELNDVKSSHTGVSGFKTEIRTTKVRDHKSEWPGAEYESGIGPAIHSWAYIPLKYFHKVQGRCYDTEGNPIRDARFIATPDNLGTVGTVDDEGYFEIYLLRVPYQQFLLGVTENESYDIVWYRQADGQRVSGKTSETDLVFVPQRVSTGLDTTADLRFR